MRWMALGLWAVLLAACASAPTLPRMGLAQCDDASRLEPGRPLAVLVHGMHGRDGLSRLAEAFRDDGQQVLCFHYDARANLQHSARELRSAVASFVRTLQPTSVTLFGHSQGGLVARAALAQSADALPAAHYRLVTVSSPFAGIRIARACGSIPYHLVSFGVSYAVCRAISGDNWNQIHPGAAMVRAPAPLDSAIAEHLLLVTDERDSCRRFSADGLHCLQDDYVFSTQEQHNALIERDARVTADAIEAGHVAVVGAQGTPRKLIQALQRRGVLGGGPSVRATSGW